MEKIDHHRTGTIHKVKKIKEGVGTITQCGKTFPHTPETSDVDESDDVDCGNCLNSEWE